MTIEASQRKPRSRPWRKDRVPKSPAAELAAPFKNPANGQFTAGNPGGRMRQLASIAKVEAASLLRLSADSVAPWLRPHLIDAQAHVQALVEGLPVPNDELVGLCGDEGRARLFASACAAEGARADTDAETARAWRQESREWAREVRQTLLTRKAVVKDTPIPRSAHATPWFIPDNSPKKAP